MRGIIAFVTNGGFLDSNTADGCGSSLARSSVRLYVYNLRGNQRTAGKSHARRKAAKSSASGSRATVAISLLGQELQIETATGWSTTAISATTYDRREVPCHRIASRPGFDRLENCRSR